MGSRHPGDGVPIRTDDERRKTERRETEDKRQKG